jgi:putative Mg2+ transporter-C (MgtC) family protein
LEPLFLAENWAPILAALAAGSLIGLERGIRSEPAGFRTHAMVAVSSAMLMVGFIQASAWLGDGATPSRVAQGVITGIGFLGAGVIFREGLSIHGLTTAASLWGVAALGLVFGVGAYAEGIAATVVLFTTLVILRIVDDRLPRIGIAELSIRYADGHALDEAGLRGLLEPYCVSVGPVRHRVEGESVEHVARLRIKSGDHQEAIATALKDAPQIVGFDLEPRNR